LGLGDWSTSFGQRPALLALFVLSLFMFALFMLSTSSEMLKDKNQRIKQPSDKIEGMNLLITAN